MRELEKKKLKLQLIKLDAAYAELEFKIEEKLDDIERIKDHLELNRNSKKEIEKQLEEEG